MSDPVSPLGGASYEGFATVRDAGPRGMITLRGDLAGAAMAKAVAEATGGDVPGQGEAATGPRGTALWFSPDELMILCDHAAAPDLAARLAGLLSGEHALAHDVSDARAWFRVEGNWRDVLMKLTPVDTHPDAFREGQVRRSRVAQAAAAFWPDAGALNLVCFRSYAPYMFALLSNAARKGSEITRP